MNSDITTLKIGQLDCLCGRCNGSDSIAYILYPMVCLDGWVDDAIRRYGCSIAVITGMDWDNDLTPWPAKGVPRGCPDFEGRAADFLATLQQAVLPTVEKALELDGSCRRTLVGVSLSGLFAMWQWMVCDTFGSIASLSGSFWYKGFAEWVQGLDIPHKAGRAYLSLGDRESRSSVKDFDSVGTDTATIVDALRKAGIDTTFQWVPGNHYADPIPRLDKAFSNISEIMI